MFDAIKKVPVRQLEAGTAGPDAVALLFEKEALRWLLRFKTKEVPGYQDLPKVKNFKTDLVNEIAAREDPDILEVNELPPTAEDTEFIARDVAGDGDCFFRATYRGVKHFGRLGDTGFPGGASMTEDAFVGALRAFVVEHADGNIRSEYEGFQRRGNYTENGYSQLMYPGWFKSRFPTLKSLRRTSLEDFADFVKAKLGERGNWAGFVDQEVVQQKFVRDRLGMEMVLPVAEQQVRGTVRDGARVSFTVKDPANTIVVANVGNAHYYFLEPAQRTVVTPAQRTVVTPAQRTVVTPAQRTVVSRAQGRRRK